MPVPSSLVAASSLSSLSSVYSRLSSIAPTPSLPTPSQTPTAPPQTPEITIEDAVKEIEAIVRNGGVPRPWTVADSDSNRTVSPRYPPVSYPAAPIEVDVVIVGGGYSGLMSGYDLQKAGVKAVVLEAKYRLGGRSFSAALKSGPGVVELGATWINKITQPKVFALTEKFGIATQEQYTEGTTLFQGLDGLPMRQGGNETAQNQTMDPSIVETARKVERVVELVDEASKAMNIRNFTAFPKSEDVTVEAYIKQKGSGLLDDPTAKAVLNHITTSIVARSPSDVGAHYFFDYVKSGFGFASLVSEGKMGAQSLLLPEGTSAITKALASGMEPGSVFTHSPVVGISQLENGVTVTTLGGQRFQAKKVILANPTNTYHNIDFYPPLPYGKRALVSRTMKGFYAKYIVTYSAPWWKEAGLQGKFTSLLGPINFGWDISVDATRQYSLAFFISGAMRNKWSEMNELSKQEAIIDHLATLVGPELADKARDVLEINYVDWTTQEWLEGGPTSSMGPGLLREYGEHLRAPFKNLVFSGGETAYEWKGYLEGAITSGNRAAKEVIASLKGNCTI